MKVTLSWPSRHIYSVHMQLSPHELHVYPRYTLGEGSAISYFSVQKAFNTAMSIHAALHSNGIITWLTGGLTK